MNLTLGISKQTLTNLVLCPSPTPPAPPPKKSAENFKPPIWLSSPPSNPEVSENFLSTKAR